MQVSVHKPVIIFTLLVFTVIATIAATTIKAEEGMRYNSADSMAELSPSAGRMVTTSVSQLPDNGMVEVSGRAERIGDGTFVLRDDTGKIKVALREARGIKLALPREGNHVNVVGQVDDGGLFGRKNIKATKITILASSLPNDGTNNF